MHSNNAQTETLLAALFQLIRSSQSSRSKHAPAKPVALRLPAPQRILFATVRSKSKNKGKSRVLLSSRPQHREYQGGT
jgi:hypothetical protein